MTAAREPPIAPVPVPVPVPIPIPVVPATEPSPLPNPWERSRRRNLPRAPVADESPSEALLLALRSRVEMGAPFDLARRICGVPQHVHEAWLARGLAIHDAMPDRLYHARGVTLGGSLEPEAEYARIVTTVQAGVAGTLVEQLYKIAIDPGRKRDQLAAITTLLRGLGERSFDPRTESEVSVAVGARPSVDQATIDAMTPEQRRALRDRARAAAAELAGVDAVVGAARARAVDAAVAVAD